MEARDLFRGPHLELRPFEPSDIPALRAYVNDPALADCRYLDWQTPASLPLSLRQVEQVLAGWAEARDEAHFAVVVRDSAELVGHAAFEWGWDPHAPAVSVVIAPAHQRRGFGSEALALLLRYAFEQTPAHNVSGGFADWNEPARRFARRHGFADAGAQRRAGLRAGRPYDWRMVDLLRPEWLAQAEGGGHAAGG